MAKKRDSQKSMQNLLKASVDVFSRRGPEAATVDEICHKAGLNKRMLYHYFSSKENLYQKALEYVYQHLLSLDISLGSMMLPTKKLVEVIIRRHHEFLLNHPEFVRMIIFENLNYGCVAKKLGLGNQEAPVITALRLALQKGREQNIFIKDIDINNVLISIISLCFSYFSNQYTVRELIGHKKITKKVLDKRIKHVVSFVFNGIVNPNYKP